MKVKILAGGGYQGTTLDVDAVPRVGETVRLGNWQGTVARHRLCGPPCCAAPDASVNVRPTGTG